MNLSCELPKLDCLTKPTKSDIDKLKKANIVPSELIDKIFKDLDKEYNALKKLTTTKKSKSTMKSKSTTTTKSNPTSKLMTMKMKSKPKSTTKSKPKTTTKSNPPTTTSNPPAPVKSNRYIRPFGYFGADSLPAAEIGQ